MNHPPSLESALKQAIDIYLKDLVEEETQAATVRIKSKLSAKMAELAPQILKRISYGPGEITIQIRP